MFRADDGPDLGEFLRVLQPETTAILSSLTDGEGERGSRLLPALIRRSGTLPLAAELLEALAPALAESPDPATALLHFERWTSELPTPSTTLGQLRSHPRLLADLVRLLASSDYLAQILARDPWTYSLLLEPLTADLEHYRGELARALPSQAAAPGLLDAMRRLKRREFLRIGWADLTGRDPLERTVARISTLADVLIQAALGLAIETAAARFPSAARDVRFAVIAMGKLGARELNYSSDVDLVFVMDSPDPADEAHRRYAAKVGEGVLDALARSTSEGTCFRVDMRLRPEGRVGSLVRSMPSLRAYYDRFAETWERQALIKSRAVAGDPALCSAFEALASQVAFHGAPGATILQDVREMRSMVERKLVETGALEGNVKEGKGTIRDIEFTVQLLQLLAGPEHLDVRVPDTLRALVALERRGLLDPGDRGCLETAYRFFREVEHRLQLMSDLPIRRLPEGATALRRLARTVFRSDTPGEGDPRFADGPAFRSEYDRLSAGVVRVVEGIQSRLGMETSADDGFRAALIAADTDSGRADLRRHLAARGFADPERAALALESLAAGPAGYRHPSSVRRIFADLSEALLAECASTAIPEAALEGLARYAERKFSYRSLFRALADDRNQLRALAHLHGSAPSVAPLIERWPELGEVVTDPDACRAFLTTPDYEQAVTARLAGCEELPARVAALRRLKLSERMRTAARHVQFATDPWLETEEWTVLCQVLLGSALRAAVDSLRKTGRWPAADGAGFAILALGRFGARDLHYASDLDLLYVQDESAGLDLQHYETLVRALSGVLQDATEYGPLFEVDLRLRPEGRQGYTVIGLEGARRYYGPGGRALCWEYQMLTRARFVAGNIETADRFLEVVRPLIYRPSMPDGWREEIAGMKRRIERERIRNGPPERHLKLGPGCLTDIEFITQVLQLEHGATLPVTSPITREVIQDLARCGLLHDQEGTTLLDAHRFLTRLRQTLWLLDDTAADFVPATDADPGLAVALGRALATDPSELLRRFHDHRRQVRAVYDRVLG